jgi:hypothetical protein
MEDLSRPGPNVLDQGVSQSDAPHAAWLWPEQKSPFVEPFIVAAAARIFWVFQTN